MSHHEHSRGAGPFDQVPRGRRRLRLVGGEAACPSEPAPLPARPIVLVVSSNLAWITRMIGLLGTAGIRCRCAGTLRAAEKYRDPELLSRVSGAVIDLSVADGPGSTLARHLNAAGIPVVMSDPAPSLDGATAAIAAGALDLLAHAAPGRDLIDRVRAALSRPRRAGGVDGLDGLRGPRDRSPSTPRQQRRPHSSDLVVGAQRRPSSRPAPRPERAEPMNPPAIMNEFGGLIRHELDIEALLRTTLEFVLAKCGPTNAAVFLPTTSGDFSLGAYVNYDCPKETVDVLLDHLANAVAPRFQDLAGVSHLCGPAAIARALGDSAGWLEDSEIIAMACRHEGEPLAICMLFRDHRNPYPASLIEQFRTIGQLFAAQLARVIRIHHRHLPRDKWGALGDAGDEGDESDGYGGGLAA